MTKGKQWAALELPLGDIRLHRDFQFRVDGMDTANLNRIIRTLEAGGETRDPVRVARVGKVLYLVDGFHRHEAYRRGERATIPALVAKMSMGEAREYAKGSNAMNGKAYSRVDQARLFDLYITEGRHLDDEGNTKASRIIAGDPASGGYSHETVRKKLKERGVELNEAVEYPGGYQPRDRDEGDLLDELADEAEDHLRRFAEALPDLTNFRRDQLLEVARGVLAAFENGDKADLTKLFFDAAPF